MFSCPPTGWWPVSLPLGGSSARQHNRGKTGPEESSTKTGQNGLKIGFFPEMIHDRENECWISTHQGTICQLDDEDPTFQEKRQVIMCPQPCFRTEEGGAGLGWDRASCSSVGQRPSLPNHEADCPVPRPSGLPQRQDLTGALVSGSHRCPLCGCVGWVTCAGYLRVLLPCSPRGVSAPVGMTDLMALPTCRGVSVMGWHPWSGHSGEAYSGRCSGPALSL